MRLNPSTATPDTPSPGLRLWPGLVAIALLLFFRFGFKLLVPGFEGFSKGMQGSLLMAAVILLWWLFASRAPWVDRLAGLLLLPAALVATWFLKHESMGPHWMAAYAVPGVFTAFVLSIWFARDRPAARRRLIVAVCVVLAAGAWGLARTDGIDGDHDGSFAWRWSPSAEDRLAEEDTLGAAGLASVTESDLFSDRDSQAQWPGFRGAARNGHAVAPATGLVTDWQTNPPEQLWRRPVGPGWSSFAVHGQRIYTQEQRGDQESVSCYRASDGEPIWRHGDPIRFFESNAGAGPRGTPTLGHGRVYTLGATGLVNALDAGDGRLIWQRDLAEDSEIAVPDWGFSGSPLLVDDRLIVAASGRLVAYDAHDGSLLWRGPDDGVSYGSPQAVDVGGETHVVLAAQHGPTGLSLAGDRLWQHDWRGFPMIQPALTADGDLLFNAGDGTGIRRLSLSRSAEGWTAEERWTSRGLKPYFNGFVVHDGHAYGFDGRILSCIELETGERQWKGGRYGNGQLVLLPSDHLLLVLSEKGDVVLVDAVPDGFNERARMPALEGKTWNHPVVVGDQLLVRNAAEMAAFRLPTV